MCASPGFPQYPHGFPHVYVDAEDGGKVRDAGIQRYRDMGIQGYGDTGYGEQYRPHRAGGPVVSP